MANIFFFQHKNRSVAFHFNSHSKQNNDISERFENRRKLKEVQSDECIVAFVFRFSTFHSFLILSCIILRDIIVL